MLVGSDHHQGPLQKTVHPSTLMPQHLMKCGEMNDKILWLSRFHIEQVWGKS